MIYPGLCSISFNNKLTWEQVVDLTASTVLRGIEWGGNIHAPHGDLERARAIKNRCRDAGLMVSSYGSYYRVGQMAPELPFAKVLDSALELGAPMIRVWAGTKDHEEVNAQEYQGVVDDTLAIAEMAAKAGVKIGFEYHPYTLTNSPAHTAELEARVRHPAVEFYWQPPFGRDADYCASSLEGVLPRLANLHVFHWTIGSPEANTVHAGMRPLKFPDEFFRHPLSEGAALWRRYFDLAGGCQGNRWALLEFIKGDEPEQLKLDAATLAQLLVAEAS